MAHELVGRDAEGQALGQWLAGRLGATASGPAVALLGGEAGVGKTALVESVLAGVAVPVRRAAGRQWQPTPFGLLRTVVPGWDGVPEPAALAAHLREGGPVVLVLDDLHWSDDASLELLAGLAAEVAADPVALIGAYRSDELPRGHLLRRIRAGLRHGRQLREIRLDTLPAPAVAQLVHRLLGEAPVPALAELIAHRTEGLPFFVEELVGALREAGALVADGGRVALAEVPRLPVPDTVRDAVLLRAARLPAPARAALDVAAIVGTEFDLDTVTALAGGDGWPDELDHSGLISVDGRGAGRFRHALTQEAVYADVPWSRRQALHLALAGRLATGGGDALLVARHRLAGHDFEQAREALLRAGDDRLRVRAYRDAAAAFRQALDLWRPGVDDAGRLSVTDRMARCAELTGEHTDAVSLLRELVDGYPGAGAQAPVHRRLAVQYELLGQWPQALAAREAAAAAYAMADAPGEAAAERLAAGAHLRSAASFRAALDVLATARADALHAGRTDLQARIDGLRGNVLCRMGRPDEGVPQVRAALDLALAHELAAPAAELYQRLADSLEHAGEYRAASQAYDSAYAFCAAHGNAPTGQLCQACATVVLFHSGRWTRAERLCREVLGADDALPHARTVAAGVLGLVHAMRGQPDPARAALLECRALAVRIDLVAMDILSSWGLALLPGPAEATSTEYRRVLRRCVETEERHYCVPVLLFAARHFAEQGERAGLTAVTEALARVVEATGQPEAQAALAFALAEAADRPLPHYRRALDLLNGLDLPIVDSQVHWRTGLAQLAGGDPAIGAESLRRAYQTAHRLGARPMAERIRADLAGPEAGPEKTPLGLSTREAQVLRLVAEGLTSREIGQRLFLSTRTVEMHVRNAMAKLGCRTRAEAVRRLIQASP